MQKNVLEYLEASARRCPDKTAFTDGARSFTYAQLLSCAKGLGTHLARTAPCLRRPVAVLIGRTAESIAAMQGVLYAGGCYVPIDDHMPEARMRKIFEQVRPAAIVFAEANRAAAELVADCAPLIFMEDGFQTEPDEALLAALREQVIDLDPLYLLFTSGSTGTPKGIVIPHRAMIDFADWMRARDLLELFGDFYADFDRNRAAAMCASLGISPYARLKTMSKGTKEKMQLVLVMSRRAQLYLLDEPIAGVDPAARDFIMNAILTNYSPEATILISTHLIGDIERVLDEAVFLRDGGVVLHDTVDNIRQSRGKSVDALFREMFRMAPLEAQEGGEN